MEQTLAKIRVLFSDWKYFKRIIPYLSIFIVVTTLVLILVVLSINSGNKKDSSVSVSDPGEEIVNDNLNLYKIDDYKIEFRLKNIGTEFNNVEFKLRVQSESSSYDFINDSVFSLDLDNQPDGSQLISLKVDGSNPAFAVDENGEIILGFVEFDQKITNATLTVNNGSVALSNGGSEVFESFTKSF